jgi:glycosyltransferase involved in cell wall biosynthesis
MLRKIRKILEFIIDYFEDVFSYFKFGIQDNKFKVSVVILCYNGEKFLNNRISSILNQTVKPYEIIFMDDASTDNSINIAKKLLDKSKIKYKIIENNINMGYANQLIKGWHLSKGDFIWVADQDDYCSTEFLRNINMLKFDESVGMIFCKSIAVDENNKKLEKYYGQVENFYDSYCVEGTFEVGRNLCEKNTIFNISSVVFRRNTLEGVGRYIRKCNVLFDWMIYVYVLRVGRICYCADVLNYHICHENSIISKYHRTCFSYEDLFYVKNYILDNYSITKENMDNMLFEIV